MCAASACSVRVVHAVVLGVWSVIWWIMGKSSGAAHGVMVSTMDSESSDPGSNPGRSSFMCAASACSVCVVHAVVLGVWSAI